MKTYDVRYDCCCQKENKDQHKIFDISMAARVRRRKRKERIFWEMLPFLVTLISQLFSFKDTVR